MNNRFSFTRISGNSKTGPIPVSMSSRNTCPISCALKGSGCYAESGMVRMHWQRLDDPSKGLDYAQFIERIKELPKGQLWRHNVAGDLLADSEGVIDREALKLLAKANKGRKGFTYTHHSMKSAHNQQSVYKATNAGFTVNLSANSIQQADKLKALNCGPVVCLLPEWKLGDAKVIETPARNLVVVCPAVTTEGITCADCRLCANADRNSIVGFPVHGVAKGRASKVITLHSKAR